ncbi:alpha/beta hydrolase family protein [Agromyces laixinhei]|uniref:alpha/beta hydrolase family protein n=1 Tax=Agromyces laixinhei TaxID=2585717 RepID=UPI001E4771E0|nr:alpha/beta fold hydrolase [Agromyces laixinhei]
MKATRIVVGAAVIGATVGTAALGGLGIFIAGRVTASVGPRRFDLAVRGVDDSGEWPIVILERTKQTATYGLFNLILENGGWVQLSEKVLDIGDGLVGREVISEMAPRTLTVGERASWSGIYFQTPADAGLDAIDVEVATPVGPAPAWLIAPDVGIGDTWAIHIHGLGSTRGGTLRGVQIANEAGLTSLVVTYRNDGEGPKIGTGRSTLGATETDDVEAAVRYAIDRGAQRVILFGWSMGGAIALQLATRPGVRERAVGLVLESPVLDWVGTIKANCASAGLPRWAGALAVPWLDSPVLARAAGLAAPVGSHRFDWVTRDRELRVPALVLHGSGDSSAPAELATRFSAHPLSAVRFEEFEADHTMTWNTDPAHWRALVADELAHFLITSSTEFADAQVHRVAPAQSGKWVRFRTADRDRH